MRHVGAKAFDGNMPITPNFLLITVRTLVCLLQCAQATYLWAHIYRMTLSDRLLQGQEHQSFQAFSKSTWSCGSKSPRSPQLMAVLRSSHLGLFLQKDLDSNLFKTCSCRTRANRTFHLSAQDTRGSLLTEGGYSILTLNICFKGHSSFCKSYCMCLFLLSK